MLGHGKDDLQRTTSVGFNHRNRTSGDSLQRIDLVQLWGPRYTVPMRLLSPPLVLERDLHRAKERMAVKATKGRLEAIGTN